MSTNRLEETVQALLAPGKGILAADETVGTISKRFESLESSPPRRAGVLTVNCSLARPVYLNSLAASSCMTRPFDKKTAGTFR